MGTRLVNLKRTGLWLVLAAAAMVLILSACDGGEDQ